MDIEVLKRQLLDRITSEDNLLEVLDILIKIIADNDERGILINNKTRLALLKGDQSRGILAYEEFSRQRILIVDSPSQLINRLDESLLIPEWMKDDSVQPLLLLEEDVILIDPEGNNETEDDEDDKDPENEIILPKYEIYTPDDLKNPEVRKQFRLQMTAAQNLIRTGTYEKAYDECLNISSNIEGNSAQLHEFLLISLFKKYGANKIVLDYLEGKGNLFSSFKLYAERLIELEEKSKGKTTDTGQKNLKRLCKYLLEELKKIYKSKEFDGKKYDYLSSKEKPEIRNYYNRVIQLAESIYKFAPIGIFFDLLLLEIAGAGNMDWLTVDGKMNIKDKPNGCGSNLMYLCEKNRIHHGSTIQN